MSEQSQDRMIPGQSNEERMVMRAQNTPSASDMLSEMLDDLESVFPEQVKDYRLLRSRMQQAEGDSNQQSSYETAEEAMVPLNRRMLKAWEELVSETRAWNEATQDISAQLADNSTEE